MKKRTGMGAAAAALLLCASAGSADVIEFNLDKVWSGVQAQGFVNVKLEDAGGDVKLTITSHLAPGEFLDGESGEEGSQGGVFLNFNPSYDLGANPLQFGAATKSGNDDFTENVHTPKENEYKADGEGDYDIRIDFGTNKANRFDGSDWVEYLITWDGGPISVHDFWYGSSLGTGQYGFFAAGHIQGIGTTTDDSGWHSPTLVPLPAPAYLGFAGLGLAAGVSVIKRRR